jgi:hypothetical protein
VAIAVLVVAGGVGLGAAIASASVDANGGAPHPDPHCDELPGWHNAPWWCRPTTTSKPPTTTTKPHVPPPTTATTAPSASTTVAAAPPVPSSVSPQAVPAAGVPSHKRDNEIASPASPPVPAITPPPSSSPIANIPGADHLFDDPGGIPVSMAVVIGAAGFATMGLVLRGTLGRRRVPLPVVDEGESLPFP